jgi:hypothetical protein
MKGTERCTAPLVATVPSPGPVRIESPPLAYSRPPNAQFELDLESACIVAGSSRTVWDTRNVTSGFGTRFGINSEVERMNMGVDSGRERSHDNREYMYSEIWSIEGCTWGSPAPTLTSVINAPPELGNPNPSQSQNLSTSSSSSPSSSFSSSCSSSSWSSPESQNVRATVEVQALTQRTCVLCPLFFE